MNLRRPIPASPNKPLPARIRLDGSGTGEGGVTGPCAVPERTPWFEVVATYETLPTVKSVESTKKKSLRITGVDPGLLGVEAPLPVSVNVTLVGVNVVVKPRLGAALPPVTPNKPVNVRLSPVTAMMPGDPGSSSIPYP
jgi:hypothetical protein